MNSKRIHEQYHSQIKLQKRIISSDNFTYRNIIKSLEKVLVNNNLEILDVGSGVGTIDFCLANKGHNVVGIDISSRAISVAKKNAKLFGLDIKFFVGNVNKFKFHSKFDLIIASEIIEHVKDDQKLLNDLSKHLTRNGIIFLSTPLYTAPLYKLGLTGSFDKRVGHLRRYSLDKLKIIIKKSNLKITKVYYQDGMFRNMFFVFPIFAQVVRVANKFSLVSDFLTLIDNIFFKLFGPTDICVIIKKK